MLQSLSMRPAAQRSFSPAQLHGSAHPAHQSSPAPHSPVITSHHDTDSTRKLSVRVYTLISQATISLCDKSTYQPWERCFQQDVAPQISKLLGDMLTIPPKIQIQTCLRMKGNCVSLPMSLAPLSGRSFEVSLRSSSPLELPHPHPRSPRGALWAACSGSAARL